MHRKLRKIVRKKNVAEFPFIRAARISFTAYYRTTLQIHSESAEKVKGVPKFRKFQKIGTSWKFTEKGLYFTFD